MKTEDLIDLDLQAVRYVAGDLAPDEVARFEERLADDQEARECVARAVRIGLEVARPAATVRSFPNVLLVAATAAVLIGSLAWYFGSDAGPEDAGAFGAEDPERVMASYLELGELSRRDEADLEDEIVAADPDAEAPSWMVQALEGK